MTFVRQGYTFSMLKHHLLAIVFFSFSFSGFPSPARGALFDHDYQVFDGILREIVKLDGPRSTVHYWRVKEKRKTVESLAVDFSSVSKTDYDQWTRELRLSFLINAFNFFTLRAIAARYPIQSVESIDHPKAVQLFGLEMTLGQLIDRYLKKEFAGPSQDLRWIFAISCGAKGCPSLSNQAYRATELERQLHVATQRFFEDSTRNFFDTRTQEISLSPWFGKYRDLFGAELYRFLAEWMAPSPEIRDQIVRTKPALKWTFFDWSLSAFPIL